MRNVGCNSFVRLSVESRPESSVPRRSTAIPPATGGVASSSTVMEGHRPVSGMFPALSLEKTLNVKSPSAYVILVRVVKFCDVIETVVALAISPSTTSVSEEASSATM